MNAQSASLLGESRTQSRLRRGGFVLALLATLFTLPLLFLGGTVTTYRVGMAVPDWPSTFGENMFTYNFWNAPFGVQLEHSHRLYGFAVGMATAILMSWLLAFDKRRWMKGLGLLAAVAVIVQAVLGGMRVDLISTLLAAVHGAVGQGFFGLLVAICVFSGSDWQSEQPTVADPARFRRRSVVLLALVYVQIVLGGWVRHFGAVWGLWLHGSLAFGVWLPAILLAIRIEKRKSLLPSLVWPGRALLTSSTLQIALGIGALVSVWPYDGTPRPVGAYQAFFRTAHQTNAAVLFASAIVLALRSFRHLAAGSIEGRTRGQETSPDRLAVKPVPLEWEAVA